MEFIWKIGGEAGGGAMVTGRTMGKLFTRGGYHVVGYPEYPSLIRGGHNVYQVLASDKKVYSPRQKSDIIVALNKDAIFFHREFINDGGALIYDSTIDASTIQIPKHVKLYPIPYVKLVTEAGGDIKMKNTVTLGVSLALIDYPFEVLSVALKDEFGRKGEEVVQKNIAVARAGYDYVKNNFKTAEFKIKVKPLNGKRRLLIAGNEAIGLGALRAGMKMYSAYPMTPASTLLSFFAAKEREYNIVVKHTEDEIAAVLYAIGGMFAGVRSMVGTSGGGFALMVEALGMAAIAETPLVMYLAQRTGPSTGMPTWTEQADLRFALHASQGEFLRVILAPGDVDETFSAASEAFNLAEKYQIPVIIMSDKFLGESHFSTERFDQSKIKIERGYVARNLPKVAPMERFHRYTLTSDGVSPRSLPGEPNGLHVSTSYEHDETGFSSESFIMRRKQVDKRAAKIGKVLKEMHAPKIYGNPKSKVAIVSWGSNKLPILDAMEVLKGKKLDLAFVHFTHLFPLDENIVQKVLGQFKTLVMVENNSTGQFAGMLKEYCDVGFDFLVLKYDGRQFFMEQVIEEMLKLNKAKWKGEKRIVVSEKEDYEYFYPARYKI
ncbi:2-oxoacid:acceptor oxidoreductase subunit alpha [Candidatus Micrarchaeota archaeon]|nr:2-oxoacid:acceptor oxidoreductase subunit alpha [Candidatus Micrarchaeota archaeon]